MKSPSIWGKKIKILFGGFDQVNLFKFALDFFSLQKILKKYFDFNYENFSYLMGMRTVI